jgi:hypothetical protein
MNYTPNEPVIRRAELPSTELQGETVLLSLEEQSYFGLRATSRRIWQMLEQPRTLEQILATLLSEYEIDRQQCEREVAVFMQRLWEARLIVPASGATH